MRLATIVAIRMWYTTIDLVFRRFTTNFQDKRSCSRAFGS